MYNEEIKRRYIQEKEKITYTPSGYLARLFHKASYFENTANKDISNFTVYEIIDFYKTLNVTSPASLAVMNSHLSLYTEWCLQQNLVLDCQNHFYEMTHDMFQDCINKLIVDKSIISRKTLYSWLDEIINPSDAFIMLALFEGIRGNYSCEIINLKMSDFNGNEVTLCTGRKLIVPNKLVDLAKESNETNEYYPVNKNGEKSLPFQESDLIVKNLYNCTSSEDADLLRRRIWRRLNRNFEYLDVHRWMKAGSLETSGTIDYIKARSQELGMSPQEYLYSDHVQEVDYKYDLDLKKTKSMYYRRYKEYLC